MLRLVGVSVNYGATRALVGIDLGLRPGEHLAVLGPSGSGKSTLLRAIAGLEPLAEGRVEWDGADLAGVPVHRRGFGLMFQDYVLFPHRDVHGNVCFGLEMHAVARGAREQRVQEVLELVGLRGYDRRRADQLSGGEQQRVALARALAPTPRLLMLDEPLGALDRALRTQLLGELAGLLADLGLPLIYVTHDQEEALAIGDRVALMNAGRLETVLPARELWRSPPSEFAARFLGLTNIIPLRLVRDGMAATPWGPLPLAAAPSAAATHLLIRPDSMSLDIDGPLSGVVAAATFRGDHTSLQVRALSPNGPPLEVRLSTSDPPPVGATVSLAVDGAGVLFLP